MEDKNQNQFVEEVLDSDDTRIYNFMINASNQANLSRSNNLSPIQLNAVFVLVNPYYMEQFNIEDLDLNLKVDEEGVIRINNKNYEMLEIEPGIKIFGVSKLKEC
ncbi:MAG: hypothetical protein GX080_04875 [Tissierellia bacterium]|nr:hypothetical protein [Tissierellia bacterium]